VSIYHVPEDSSHHMMSWQVQAFNATKLPCSQTHCIGRHENNIKKNLGLDCGRCNWNKVIQESMECLSWYSKQRRGPTPKIWHQQYISQPRSVTNPSTVESLQSIKCGERS